MSVSCLVRRPDAAPSRALSVVVTTPPPGFQHQFRLRPQTAAPPRRRDKHELLALISFERAFQCYRPSSTPSDRLPASLSLAAQHDGWPCQCRAQHIDAHKVREIIWKYVRRTDSVTPREPGTPSEPQPTAARDMRLRSHASSHLRERRHSMKLPVTRVLTRS